MLKQCYILKEINSLIEFFLYFTLRFFMFKYNVYLQELFNFWFRPGKYRGSLLSPVVAGVWPEKRKEGPIWSKEGEGLELSESNTSIMGSKLHVFTPQFLLMYILFFRTRFRARYYVKKCVIKQSIQSYAFYP